MPDKERKTLGLQAVTGRLARKPELRVSSKGNYYSTGSIAVSFGFPAGESRFAPTVGWLNITALNALAQPFTLLSKDDTLLVSGYLSINEYVGSDGQDKRQLQMLPSEIYVLVYHPVKKTFTPMALCEYVSQYFPAAPVIPPVASAGRPLVPVNAADLTDEERALVAQRRLSSAGVSNGHSEAVEVVS
jgi:hypothetical protein